MRTWIASSTHRASLSWSDSREPTCMINSNPNPMWTAHGHIHRTPLRTSSPTTPITERAMTTKESTDGCCLAGRVCCNWACLLQLGVAGHCTAGGFGLQWVVSAACLAIISRERLKRGGKPYSVALNGIGNSPRLRGQAVAPSRFQLEMLTSCSFPRVLISPLQA